MLRSTLYSLCGKCNKTLLNVRPNSTTSICLENGIDIDGKAAKAETKRRSIAWEDAKPLEMMPGPKPLPLLGNTWRFILGEYKGMDPVVLYKRLHETYGPICHLRDIVGMRDAVILFDPNDVQDMYLNEGQWPERRILKCLTHYRTVIRKDIYKDVYGLPVSQGEEWFKLRSAVNPLLLQPRVSEDLIPKIEVAAREFVKRIGKLAAIHPQMREDFMFEINKYTMESVSYVTLNRRFGLLNDELTTETIKIITSTMRVFELMYELDMQPSIWIYIPTPKWREYIEHMDFLTGMYMNVIEEEMERLLQTTHFVTEEDKCILQKFVHVDKRVAVTIVFDTMAAGLDTHKAAFAGCIYRFLFALVHIVATEKTSKTVGALMYLLAKHKRAQKKLRKELLEVFPDPDVTITPAHLSKCKYLKAVIKEGTRLHGVAIAQLRNAPKNFVLGGYRIPKGIDIIGAQCVMVKSEEFIKRSKEFIPERFLRESADEDFSMANVHKHIYLPFGFGPRSCLGRRLANLELEISLALIIRKFRLDWQEPNMNFKASIMYGLCDPLKIHVYPLEPGVEIDDPNEDLDRLDYAPELE